MALGEPLEPVPNTENQSITFHRLECVLRATGTEATAGRKGGRYKPLVPANQCRANPTRPLKDRGQDPGVFDCTHPSTSALRSLGRAVYVAGRVRTTMSIGPKCGSPPRRQISFNCLRKRLRATAFDWNFGTINPSLGWPASFTNQAISRCVVRWRRPRLMTRRTSLGEARRSRRAKPSEVVSSRRAWTESKWSSSCGPSYVGAQA